MKLKHLFKNLPVRIKGPKDLEVKGITSNSQTVKPGDLFIAKKGLKQDGSQYIPMAVKAGASCILTDLYNPFLENVAQIICLDVEALELDLLNRFYELPQEKIEIFGITGTNGKTTTSYLIQHLLKENENLCGLIGTNQWLTGRSVLPSTHTTPDRATLYRLFHEMIVNGCKSVVMEVSSHALDQDRVKGIFFQGAVFTNLSLDHLDYHLNMDAYAFAKSKLFSSLDPLSFAVVNRDAPDYLKMIASCRARVLLYGFHEEALLRASDLKLTSGAVEFNIHYEGNKYPFKSFLVGRFNVYNLLAALGLGIMKGLPIEHALAKLSTFRGVEGRLERVANQKGLNIFVDYAHTDDALENVLVTLKEFTKGRLILIFGCGGNRDVSKRSKMGAVADLLADFTIVTTDNPRHEKPEEIVREIIKGFKDKSRFVVEIDRQEAIFRGIGLASKDDVVLIAGKGHETYQIFQNEVLPFDDKEVARRACSR